MKYLIAGIACSALACGPVAAQSQPPATGAAQACDALRLQWRAAEEEMAVIASDGIADNSAPRATMRAIRMSNELATAQIIISLMAANRCPAPKRAPSPVTFGIDANKCGIEMLKGNYSAVECKRENWKPIGSPP